MEGVPEDRKSCNWGPLLASSSTRCRRVAVIGSVLVEKPLFAHDDRNPDFNTEVVLWSLKSIRVIQFF